MDQPALNVLSLCAGVGGLDLGVRMACRAARVVCYVEREAYACEVLASRMADQALDEAPIWTDLVAFDGRPWRGLVDLVIGGVPCQPWSVAGKRAGTSDERWLWPAFTRVVRDVGPRLVFLENVPGFISGGGLGLVLGDLAALGFDAEWDVFSAADVGAPQLRRRVFVLGAAVGDAAGARLAGQQHESRDDDAQLATAQRAGRDALADAVGLPPFPPGPTDHQLWSRLLAERTDVEPAICRMVDGLADRVDRLRATGNGVVPQQAAFAFRVLRQRLMER